MKKGQQTKTDIINAANRLFYTRGYAGTSVADVAAEVGITKGNLHYHFKSKDDLLHEVLEGRLARLNDNLSSWEREFTGTAERLKRFVRMLLIEEDQLLRFGCPIGTINLELGKTQQHLRDDARRMFDVILVWLDRQFRKLGYGKAQSRHLLAKAQGAALLCTVYEDRRLLRRECRALEEWIDGLVH